jgi:hypothetical protein
MSNEIVTVHLRLTRPQHEKLKAMKGDKTWEEFVLSFGDENEN